MEDHFRFTLEASPFADIPAFYCSPCERPFSSWDGLVSHVLLARAHRHIKSEEDLSDLDFPCGGCNRTFKSSQSRLSHLLCSKRHKENPKGYPDNVCFTCDACNRDYPTAGSLHAHASHSQKHLKKLNNNSKLKIKAWFHVTTAVAPIRAQEEVTAMAEEVYCNGLRVEETATNSRNAAIEEVTDRLNGVSLSSQPKAQKNKNNRRRHFQGRGARKAIGGAEDVNLPYKCVPCNRAYKSAYALADHKRQSPAHKQEQEPGEEAKPASRPKHIMEEEVDVPYPWSKFPRAQREELFELLEDRVHGVFTLFMHRYQVQEDDDQEYKKKHYMCLICKGYKTKVEGKPCYSHPRGPPYPCCDGKTTGCIEGVHEFTFVPDLACTDPGPSKATPPPVPNTPKHRAVAFDCEMVGYLPYKSSTGLGKERSEVISLSAVDMLTGKILINTLVKPPKGGQIRWRKRFTGMDPRKLAMAEVRRQVLPSWEAARQELWKYIDSSTILVGHALHHDLRCLRMVHTRVVDSEILAKDPAFGFGDRRQWSLRNLCSRQLGIMIQSAYKPHDALEDTYATREVVLSMLQGLRKSDGKNIVRQN